MYARQAGMPRFTLGLNLWSLRINVVSSKNTGHIVSRENKTRIHVIMNSRDQIVNPKLSTRDTLMVPAISCPVAPNARATVDAHAQGWDALLSPGVAPHQDIYSSQ